MTAGGISNHERERIAIVCARIASVAGIAVMDVFNSDFTSRTKADSSPVSDADERAEVIILEQLAKEFPGVPIIAEEQAAADGLSHRRPGELFFLVDPVDGTREFIAKKHDFTVNIGLVEKGLPIAGAVYAPAREEMFTGGARALRWTKFLPGADPEPDAATATVSREYPGEGLTAVVSSSHLTDETQAFVDRLTLAKRVSFGSSLKFCRVATGEADVYPRWGPTMEWDTAAGHAVLNAAGGCVVSPDGEPFLYGAHMDGFRNGPFVAWGRGPLITA